MEVLTQEQKMKIYEEMKAEEKRKEAEKVEKIKEYKNLVEEVVEAQFGELVKLAQNIATTKKNVFENFETIIQLKEELYGVKDNQQSHTFTTGKGLSITLGTRMLDNFDDTVHVGIEKVKNYIRRVTDGSREELTELVNLLLKKDKNGNLKANRVLELEKIALRIDDEELKEGVEIIKMAYKPLKSSKFIEIYYKDNNGVKRGVPLSMTGVDNINWEEIKDETTNKEASN